MDSKLDRILEKLTTMFDTWLAEFETNPVRTALKVILILWVVKWARRNLR